MLVTEAPRRGRTCYFFRENGVEDFPLLCLFFTAHCDEQFSVRKQIVWCLMRGMLSVLWGLAVTGGFPCVGLDPRSAIRLIAINPCQIFGSWKFSHHLLFPSIASHYQICSILHTTVFHQQSWPQKEQRYPRLVTSENLRPSRTRW